MPFVKGTSFSQIQKHELIHSSYATIESEGSSIIGVVPLSLCSALKLNILRPIKLIKPKKRSPCLPQSRDQTHIHISISQALFQYSETNLGNQYKSSPLHPFTIIQKGIDTLGLQDIQTSFIGLDFPFPPADCVSAPQRTSFGYVAVLRLTGRLHHLTRQQKHHGDTMVWFLNNVYINPFSPPSPTKQIN